MPFIALFGFFFIAAIFFVYILVASLIVWMAIDAGKQDKFWWIVLILGVPVIGAVVYYFTEKEGDYAKIPKESCEHCKNKEADHKHQ